MFVFFLSKGILGRSKMFHLLNAKGSVPRAVIGVRGRQTYLSLGLQWCPSKIFLPLILSL
jgi:hypothetical protein